MNWKDLVRGVAPTIGAALGGPAAGIAVKYLATELLGKPEATESEVAQFVNELASPDQLLQLKKLEQEFALKMKELNIDVFRLEVADRQGAREMAKFNIWPQVVLSTLFIVGYFSIMGGLIYFSDIEINDRVLGILNTVVGVLTAAIPMILQFWFGSSMGSKEKDLYRHKEPSNA